MCLDHGPHHTRLALSGADRPARTVRPSALSRRDFVFVLVGAGGAVLAGCAGGETGLGLDLVSDEQVEQMGVENWERIRSETPASDNRAYQQTLQQVGGNLLQAAGENPADWEMVVFEGAEANAFALPGNKIGVFEGLFDYAENEDQLATVIGHEIAHNQAEHAAERLSSQAATNVGLQLISVALQAGNIGYANQVAALLGAGAQYGLILPYSRNQELEADRNGLLIMAEAGYDPRESVELWRNMATAGERPPDFLSTHPGPEDRIAQLESLMPEALALYQES
jgi:predicted Zn-dependent protease